MDVEQRAKNMAVIAAEFRAMCHELEDEVERLRAEIARLRADNEGVRSGGMGNVTVPNGPPSTQPCAFCGTLTDNGLTVLAACDEHWDQPEAELARLREQLRIATDQLEAFSAQWAERYPGEMGTFAHDALIRMSVVE